jgi:leucyl aminopeptidase (aminopeptidase T)
VNLSRTNILGHRDGKVVSIKKRNLVIFVRDDDRDIGGHLIAEIAVGVNFSGKYLEGVQASLGEDNLIKEQN